MMYVTVCIRLDIPHVMDVVIRYMEKLRREQWDEVKWVLQYLRGTNVYCITCNGSSDYVCRFVDLDFVGDLDKRRPTLGYVFTLAG